MARKQHRSTIPGDPRHGQTIFRPGAVVAQRGAL